MRVEDRGVLHDLAVAGWRAHRSSSFDGELGTLTETTNYLWQDEANPTLRFGIQADGRTIWSEFSGPKLLHGRGHNMDLLSGEAAMDATAIAYGKLAAVLPDFDYADLHKFSRLDTALDVYAGETRAGVIAAGGQFHIPRARGLVRQVYPGETATVHGSRDQFRCYDKSLEMDKKAAKQLVEWERKRLDEARAKGLVRLEYADRNRKGLTVSDVGEAHLRLADRLEAGFSGGVVFIGGLDQLRAQVYALGVSSQRRSSLIEFAVLWAELRSQDAMKAVMSKPTYYRRRRQFLAAGLSPSDVCSWSGEVDFRPALKVVRAA
jgi:hypothetical protein